MRSCLGNKQTHGVISKKVYESFESHDGDEADFKHSCNKRREIWLDTSQIEKLDSDGEMMSGRRILSWHDDVDEKEEERR